MTCSAIILKILRICRTNAADGRPCAALSERKMNENIMVIMAMNDSRSEGASLRPRFLNQNEKNFKLVLT